ncbi:hypothetical protein A9Q84_07345 [Halobacteriovorax marinus]|uniref:TRAM domain-containing protein n=1 Tax=Halobacteriovorax marinus TaxID=97084 RepID=A0A1Y5F5K9_9BACT|nr:hypothetical protein A9Q84_07345 [Halobacteriovorax marinus]
MKKIEFKIDHIDPLGQGISKNADQVAFIEKTLPGESGNAKAFKTKKKGRLIFSRLTSTDDLTEVSPLRIEATCPHFANCSGCHYLHTSYENEIELKSEIATRLFSYVSQMETAPKIVAAPERFYYRNRIQLHYNKVQGKLGFIDSLNGTIEEIPSCKVINSKLSLKLAELYKDNHWLLLVKDSPESGHIEIYERDGVVEVHTNQRYAFGGFTQVNEVMNQKMITHLHSEVRKYIKPGTTLLDLFGGAGNLSKDLSEYPTLVIDGFSPEKMNLATHQEFEEINLYGKGAIDEISQKVSPNQELAIILDPPRSGLKNIQELVEKLKPKYIFMINCEVSSAIRDIKSLKLDFKIKDVTILDLFPGTRHFETVSTLCFC